MNNLHIDLSKSMDTDEVLEDGRGVIITEWDCEICDFKYGEEISFLRWERCYCDHFFTPSVKLH